MWVGFYIVIEGKSAFLYAFLGSVEIYMNALGTQCLTYKLYTSSVYSS